MAKVIYVLFFCPTKVLHRSVEAEHGGIGYSSPRVGITRNEVEERAEIDI
jgi:hypothetical protein